MLYWANWIARDEDGRLNAFASRPQKRTGIELGYTSGKWVVDFDEHQSNVVDADGKYDGVKWTDEFPTHIVWG